MGFVIGQSVKVLQILKTSFIVSQRGITTMSCSKLEAIPEVEIDDNGVFKYILVKVYSTSNDGSEISKLIVRGYSRCTWHADIYDEVQQRVTPLGLDTECCGGGRINHQGADKKLRVYSLSEAFGKADHSISTEILKKAYPQYNITWDDSFK